VITINQTAADFNWYVSTGSASSPAFGLVGPDGESLAEPGNPAADEVDLATVLEHELGHVLGLPDNAVAGDLMDITLGLGVRRLPGSADLAAFVSSSSTLVTDPTIVAAVPALVGQSAAIPNGIAVAQSQSCSPTGPIPSAAVDAALASMLSPAGGNGDDPLTTVINGYPITSASRGSSPKIAIRQKGKTAPPALRHSDAGAQADPATHPLLRWSARRRAPRT
jgi:hypothetical protein